MSVLRAVFWRGHKRREKEGAGNWWWEIGEKGTKEGKMGRGRIGVSG